MSAEGESPNPYESPRTVSAGESAAVKVPVRATKDRRYETIGFAALTLTAVVGLAFAYGAFYLATKLSPHPQWGWVDTALRVVGVLIAAISFPLLIVCLPWTLVSAARWALGARTGYVAIEKQP